MLKLSTPERTEQYEWLKAKYEKGTIDGSYDDISNEVYHACSNFSFGSSQLKYLASTSPKHFKNKYIPYKNEPPTEPMKIGQAFHIAVYEPDMWDQNVFVMPELNLRTKDGRENKKKYLDENEDKAVISPAQEQKVKDMAASIRAHEPAHKYLTGGVAERTYFWTDKYSNITMKCRPDYLVNDTMVELKSTFDASKQGFSRQIANLYYHLALDHYLIGIEAVDGKRPSKVRLLACENEAPYVCAVRKPAERMMAVGHYHWIQAFTDLEIGITMDNWRGYGDDEEEIDLPIFAIPEDLEG